MEFVEVSDVGENYLIKLSELSGCYQKKDISDVQCDELRYKQTTIIKLCELVLHLKETENGKRI